MVDGVSMSYAWATITPVNPSGYTYDSFLGMDNAGVFYATFKGPDLSDSPGVASHNLMRSIDGSNWTNPLTISDNTKFKEVVDTGSVLWALPVTAGGYVTAYLYYSKDHGLTWHAWTSVGPCAWTNGCAGTDGHLYMLRNGNGYGVYVIADNLTYTTWGYTNSSHYYNYITIDSGNNVYAQFDDGTLYRFTQSMGSIYTTLTQLKGLVTCVAKTGSTYLAFDTTNSLVLSSPDADVNDWTAVSALAGLKVTSFARTMANGSILVLTTDSGTGGYKLSVISADLAAVTDIKQVTESSGLWPTAINVVNNVIYYGVGNQLYIGTPVVTKTLYVYSGGWKTVQSVYTSSGGVWKQATSISGTLNGKWS